MIMVGRMFIPTPRPAIIRFCPGVPGAVALDCIKA